MQQAIALLRALGYEPYNHTVWLYSSLEQESWAVVRCTPNGYHIIIALHELDLPK